MISIRRVLIAVVVIGLIFIFGYYAGRHSAQLADVMKPGQQTARTGIKLGPWKASFRVPGTVHMPDANPVVECDFLKPFDFQLGFLGMTVRSLSDRSYLVRYHIYGYDAKGRRISDGGDEFAIGPRERVVRKVFLKSHDPGIQSQLGSTFWVQMTLEE